jgi:hypothetical protein
MKSGTWLVFLLSLFFAALLSSILGSSDWIRQKLESADATLPCLSQEHIVAGDCAACLKNGMEARKAGEE